MAHRNGPADPPGDTPAGVLSADPGQVAGPPAAGPPALNSSVNWSPNSSAGAQGMLFVDGLVPTPDDDIGYRIPTACAAAGITYRRLDYWARTGLVEPSIRGASGSGTQRLYSFRDILVLKIIRRLLDTGVSLQNIRVAVEHLRRHGVEDLARITLMSDGATVYECTSADEVVDLVQGGQGVFGIAVGRVVREVEGALAELPGERADDAADEGSTLDADSTAGPDPSARPDADELSRRRLRRTSA